MGSSRSKILFSDMVWDKNISPITGMKTFSSDIKTVCIQCPTSINKKGELKYSSVKCQAKDVHGDMILFRLLSKIDQLYKKKNKEFFSRISLKGLEYNEIKGKTVYYILTSTNVI